ncbi:ventral anterior homeobox 2 [Hypanus sabinus]|uniref:ventral anterior homeobox 2 n=1 Tax=Hypanus sabinus TaxID=79690 RepID=UPI0028C4936C|nr:ventral anterior homeobox 2 [Hypanus sabinus]
MKPGNERAVTDRTPNRRARRQARSRGIFRGLPPAPPLLRTKAERWNCLSVTPITAGEFWSEVKVWFQNRRTKQKKDQSRNCDNCSPGSSESKATCNILRLLEQRRLLPAPPAAAAGLLPCAPSPPGSSAGCDGCTLVCTTGSLPFGLATPTGATSPTQRLGSTHELSAGYGVGTSAFEPYAQTERSDSGSDRRLSS